MKENSGKRRNTRRTRCRQARRIINFSRHSCHEWDGMVITCADPEFAPCQCRFENSKNTIKVIAGSRAASHGLRFKYF
ncbi:MAG TPA: hypothetical protein VHZ76_00755 [Gammaproteobacteria bacterium]|nr:hypothetical protein [Gammaproteobacteria bacterium]